MAKVNYEYLTPKVFFNSISTGNYFIYGYKLYLKVGRNSAFDFDEDIFTTIDDNARCF